MSKMAIFYNRLPTAARNKPTLPRSGHERAAAEIKPIMRQFIFEQSGLKKVENDLVGIRITNNERCWEESGVLFCLL